MNPDFDAINAVFGNEDSFGRHLQDMAVNPPNNTIEWFQSESDSVRVFYTHISHPIELAFQTPSGTPFVVQRSESGPLGSTNVSQTVDFNWGHGERCLLLGELKRHRIIDPRRWTGQLPADGNRTWLGKEIRASVYNHPNAHGTLLLRLTENDSSSTDGKFWACHECYNIFDAEATTSAAKHLRQRHGIPKDGERLGANTAGKRSSPAIDELFQARTTKKTKLPPPAKIQRRFQELLVKQAHRGRTSRNWRDPCRPCSSKPSAEG
ncbi:hypothetical protein N658DRAFT_501868 [Parathielavia hyrcaniae]|uniref:Uncharacterized protein n=1 Tax=Parathielavia hyrcaniae TaxID=113614 RepID=A0AAN6PT51_9PEZI|nr:hypothetical protein N658DRAFT_501868 [Parathielavia hyrcaniae]